MDSENQVKEIGPSDELLWRQIHPSWVTDGRATSQAFKPTPKDNSKLSVSRSSKVSAKESFDYHTNELQLTAVFTLAVTAAEADESGFKVFDDSEVEDVKTPGHAYIGTQGCSNGEVKKQSKGLARAANTRGIQHPK